MKPLMLAGWIAAFGADITSTKLGLVRGGHEVVFPTQSPTKITGILIGEGTFGYWVYKKTKPKHPKLAIIMYVVTITTHGLASAYNFHQAAQHGR